MSDLTRDKLIEAMADAIIPTLSREVAKALAIVALDAIGALAAVVPREADEDLAEAGVERVMDHNFVEAPAHNICEYVYEGMVAAADLSRPALSEGPKP